MRSRSPGRALRACGPVRVKHPDARVSKRACRPGCDVKMRIGSLARRAGGGGIERALGGIAIEQPAPGGVASPAVESRLVLGRPA
jgi:hypothetical protein